MLQWIACWLIIVWILLHQSYKKNHIILFRSGSCIHCCTYANASIMFRWTKELSCGWWKILIDRAYPHFYENSQQPDISWTLFIIIMTLRIATSWLSSLLKKLLLYCNIFTVVWQHTTEASDSYIYKCKKGNRVSKCFSMNQHMFSGINL